MKKDATIRQHLIEFYRDLSPSPALRRELVAEAQAVEVGAWTFGWRRAAAMAAALLLVGLSALVVVWRLGQPVLPTAVAEEIALNHRKALAAEFTVGTFEDLASAMDKLDFSPRMPRRLQTAGLGLEGARYCSIRGSLAAQVRLTDPDGRSRTLYEVPVRGDLARLEETVHQIGRVEVRLWREGDLLFGLAVDSEP